MTKTMKRKTQQHFITARKRSLGQGNIFRSVYQEICSQEGRDLPHCMLGYPPGTRDRNPSRGRHPPGPEVGTPPSWSRPPPRKQRQAPSQEQTPPKSSACWEIRATSGRYASYWNAILWESCKGRQSRWENYMALVTFDNLLLVLLFYSQKKFL